MPESLGREQPIERTAEIQRNYLNFKQKLDEKKFSHLKSQRKPTAAWQQPPRSSSVPKVDN